MRLDRIVSLTITIILFWSIFIVYTVPADDSIDTLVDATFNIEFETATDLKITVVMDVNKITVFGTTYNNADIQSLASSSETSDIEDMGAIKLNLIQLLDEQISATIEEGVIGNLGVRPIFEDGAFHHEYNVNLTSSFFEMNQEVDAYEFINGVLDMGAFVNYSFNFYASTGWNNTYIMNLGKNIGFKRTSGTALTNNTIRWTLKNWEGNKPNKISEIQLKMDDPTTTNLESDDIFLEFVLDSKNVYPTSLKSNVLLNSIDIREYNILPSFISNIDYITADGIRLFTKNGFFSWNDVYDTTIKPIEEEIKTRIEQSSFNQTLDLIFDWGNDTAEDCINAYEITNMDSKPAVKGILTDESVEFKIFGITSRALFGLINAGAEANISEQDINFGDKLNLIGYNYNVSLSLPENLFLEGENVYTWNETNKISGDFESDIASQYSDEDINTVIEIEVKSTDLNLLSFFTGKTEMDFRLGLKETRNYKVMALPDEFQLPEKVLIDYLNSDAFRICVKEEVFSEKSVNNFLSTESKLFENNLKSTLPGLEMRGKTNKKAFDESINNWDGDISMMDSNNPVEVCSYSNSIYPISFDLNFLPPGFNVPKKTFNFSGLPNQNVTYKMIFPQGISIDIRDSLNKAEVKKTKDDKQYIEISFNSSESNLSVLVSCKMTPSALFIIGIFMPCIVSLIITIILIAVIYILRKKRKVRKLPTYDDSEDVGGYEDEDYYIPPPPESK